MLPLPFFEFIQAGERLKRMRQVPLIDDRSITDESYNLGMGSLKPEFPSLGWKQILTTRKKILDEYDRAREQARAHEVETAHGRVAEAQVRKWLSGFLPRRYGVTSGYVISPGLSSAQKAPHFDVIIYDQLESPILWIEENPDTSTGGQSMAIPVEHVCAVLEIKSSLSARTMRDALEHLGDLFPLMQAVDNASEPYKLHLSPKFRCGVLFIELRKQEENSGSVLPLLINGLRLRGFLGGLVLRGEGHTTPLTGRMALTQSETATEGRHDPAGLLEFGLAKSVQLSEKVHIGAVLTWSEPGFVQFAFDLVALLQGTYRVGYVSSFYGIGSAYMDLIRDVGQNS